MERTVAAGVMTVLSCLLVLGSSGCGAGSGPGDNPVVTAQRFLDAIADSDDDQACALMARDGKPLSSDQLQQCTTAFGARPDDGGERRRAIGSIEVKRATVNGDTAKVEPPDTEGETEDQQLNITLVRVGGRWYVDYDRCC